ncbi:PorP/SprF family type IX secretion system membrane protein [Roseivirga echinicomitans]
MKKLAIILFVGVLFGSINTLSAQQAPLFNQYFTQPTLGYSSTTAFSKQTQLGLMYRGQWSGLEGAPELFAVSFSKPFKNSLGYNFNLQSFQLGFLKQTYLGAGFSKALKLEAHRFSMGAEVGMSLFSLNESRISVESLNDELIQNLFGNKGSVVNLNLSLSYQYKSLNTNFVAINVIEEGLSGEGYTELNRSNRDDYMFGVGYEFQINALNQISFSPSLTWRYQSVLGSSFDIASKFDFKDKFQFTAGYRQNYGATAGMGIHVKPNILFTYNYDFGKSDVPFLSDGFNEIGLHFSFVQGTVKAIASSNGEAIIERLRNEEIYDRKLISAEDQAMVVNYLAENETGGKRERLRKADIALDTILKDIETKGLARMRAEAEIRLAEQAAANLEAKQMKEAEEQAKVAREQAEEARLKAQEQLLAELAKVEVKEDLSNLNNSYLLVVGSYFPNSRWSGNYLKSLKSEYPQAGIYQNSERGYDYVYILAFNDLGSSIKAMNELKTNERFLDSWVHIMKINLKK